MGSDTEVVPALPPGFTVEADATGAPTDPAEQRAYFAPIAAAAAERHGVPRDLFLWQIGQESGFNPNARNNAPGTHATGIAQFQPSTARGRNLDPTDPVASLDQAASYMAELHQKTGDWGKALDAYGTTGPGSSAKVNAQARQMLAGLEPPPPAGFKLEDPPPPPGFTVEGVTNSVSKSVTPQYGLRAAPPPTFLDRVREHLFGSAAGETALGRAFPSLAGGRMTNTPTVDLPVAQFEQPLPADAGPATYIAHGMNQALSGLLTPKNLAIMAATSGMGAVVPATGYASVAGQAVNLGLGAYFTYQMGANATDAMKAAYAAHQAGNDGEAARLLGYGSVSGLLAAAGLMHARASRNAILKTQVPAPEARPLNPEVVPPEAQPEPEPLGKPAPQTVDVKPATEPPPPPGFTVETPAASSPQSPQTAEAVKPSPSPAVSPAVSNDAAKPVWTLANQMEDIAHELEASGHPAPFQRQLETQLGEVAQHLEQHGGLPRPTPADYAKPGALSDIGAPPQPPQPLTPAGPSDKPIWTVAQHLEDIAQELEAQGHDSSFVRAAEVKIGEIALAHDRTLQPEGEAPAAPPSNKVDERAIEEWRPEMADIRTLTGQYRTVAPDGTETPYTSFDEAHAAAQGNELTVEREFTDKTGTHWQELDKSPKRGAPEPTPQPASEAKPVTPQVPHEPGTKYVLPGFVTAGAQKGSGSPAEPPREEQPATGAIVGFAHPKMAALVDELQAHIASRTPIENTPALVKIATRVLGDPLTAGRYDVKDLYDALETAVNRYVSGEWGRELMHFPAKRAIEILDGLTGFLPTQTARTETQREFQQFSTPPTLSYLAAKAAAIRPGETMLEPSAGTGSIAAFGTAAGAHVEVNELDAGRAALLKLQGYEPTQFNAERIRDHRPDLKPSVVVMNPPFSATAGRKTANRNNIGFQHVVSALDLLPPGGRLVAILGRGASFDHPTAVPFWKKIADLGASVRANVGLDGENYKKYGTTFDNRLLIVDRVPTTGQQPVTGEFKDLADAYDALQPVIDSRPAATVPASPPAERPESPVGASARGSGVRDREELPASEAGNGGRRSGRRRSGQPASHAARPGASESAEPAPREEPAAQPGTPGDGTVADHARISEPARRDDLTTPEAPGDIAPVEQQGTYQSYQPQKLKGGISHVKATGTALVETSALASVESPDLSYKPDLPAKAIATGHISDAQLEAITYAGQAHQQELPDGKRAGFMVGDGTGVGKGTEAAGIALDNWNKGRKKTLWLSLKGPLIKQAQRDLDWVDAPIKARMLNDWDFDQPIAHEGVVFASYNMLHQVSPQGKGSRLEQIIAWNPDVILMDESHAAKNAVVQASGDRGDDDDGGRGGFMRGGTTSKAGEAVLDLSAKLPQARITYFSATAFTDTRNLGYASRLGLWGENTSFPGGFQDFLVQIDRGGIGAMELVAKEMKATGRYMARQVSFQGVDYREARAELTKGQREMYDAAVEAWQKIFTNIDKAIASLAPQDDKKSQGIAKMRATSQFWSSNQRFYRSLITAMKIPAAIEEIEKALAEEKSVFLDLVSTGEAESRRQLLKATEQDLMFDDLDMSAKQMIVNYLDHAFPVNLMEDYEDPETGSMRSRPVLDADGNPVQSQAALAIREDLKKGLDKIQLPQAPMDQVIDYFGPEQVAEVSGRKSRIVQDQKTGRPVEIQRVKPKGAVAKDVNDWERQQFQSGKKRIAIASGAAGTGFDFHSDKRIQNQQRRVHIVLEPSWSADVQMQKFGRTHRTNQAIPPQYILLASDLGGEKRFISAIASRIASLGALTHGERKAGGGAAEMLAKYNLEGKYGEAATGAFFRGMQGDRNILQDDVAVSIPKPPAELAEATFMGINARGAMAVFRLLGAVYDGAQGPVVNTTMPIKTFLNRVLNLPTHIQAPTFEYFMSLFEHIISAVKAAGAFDEGTTELKAESARIVRREQIRGGEGVTPTHHITISAQFKAEKNTWKDAVAHRQQGSSSDYHQQQLAGVWRNTRSGKLWMARRASRDITDPATGAVTPAMTLLGPQEGSRQQVPAADLSGTGTKAATHWERVPSFEAEEAWEAELAKIPDLRQEDVHLINGSVLPVWRQLAASSDGYKMDVSSIKDDQGRTISGIRIPADQIGPLTGSLSGTGEQSPDMLLNRIWRQNERIPIRDGTISASRVMGERAIVIQMGSKSGRDVLDSMGIQHIETASAVRHYLAYSDQATPAERAETVQKLGQVLQAFPPQAPAPGESGAQREAREIMGRQGQQNAPKKDDDPGVTLGSGLGAMQPYIDRFLKHNVVPTAKQLAELFKLSKRELVQILAPAAVPGAGPAALNVRKNAAQLARDTDIVRATLEVAEKFFAVRPAHENFDFIDRVEHGRDQATPELQQFADLVREILDTRREAVQALGTGKLQNFIENYFPHLWKDPKAAAQAFANAGKRPLEGTKAFLKKRTIETFADGIALGLEPFSNNPVDLVLAKVREMDKYLMAHHLLSEEKAAGRLQFNRATRPVPAGWQKINDKVATVWGTPSHEGAMQIEGYWVAPEPAARILNNYLSPGLRDKSAIVRGYMSFANFMNQLQLGLSGFHAVFTSLEAVSSHLALGIYQAAHGDVLKAAKTIALSPAAPFTSVMRGDKMLKAWSRPGTQGALIGELADAAVQAGGRASQERFYQTHVGERMVKAWKEGDAMGAFLRVPFAAFEVPTRIIMEGLVPRLKLGAFADMAQYELERLGTNATDAEVQAALAKAWDSIDNRFGQLVYDNLFWHKYTKDVGMMLIRSLGWLAGDVREIVGGTGDTARFMGNLALKAGGRGGARPEFTHRMSYIPAHLIVAASVGALLYYLWHGHAPHKLKDYFFPTDPHAHRWSPATYVKDEYNWKTDPVGTAASKLNPLIGFSKAVLTNRDFRERKIVNPHHKFPKEVREFATFVMHEFEPLWVEQLQTSPNRSLDQKVLPELGITRAPRSLDHPSHR
jgi:hypothetical protein